jgi:hypothetical protein
LVTVLLAILGAAGPVSASGSAGELQAIEQAVTYYLEGGKAGKVELLEKAFHESAEIECVQNGELVSWDLPTFLGFFDPARPSDHVHRILSVDFAGDAAAVKAEWDFGSWKYIDYLSLLKVGGEWKIVHKIFYRTQP